MGSASSLEVIVMPESARWETLLPFAELEQKITQACRMTADTVLELQQLEWQLSQRGLKLSVTVALADDARLQVLNRDFRGKDKPTNVLSFPAYDSPLDAAGEDPAIGVEGVQSFGDIIIAYETVVEEARAQGKPPIDHLLHLVVHGCVHLCGHDHEAEEEAEIMEAIEIKVLKQLSIANPYEICYNDKSQ